ALQRRALEHERGRRLRSDRLVRVHPHQRAPPDGAPSHRARPAIGPRATVPPGKPEVPPGKPEVPPGKPEVPPGKPEVPPGKPEPTALCG
ncbi:MAG: hypothetical protein EXR75_09715, partial [Myxococcales bacterium]|nr:hypothetical protein [Myxococcales bacterium]